MPFLFPHVIYSLFRPIKNTINRCRESYACHMLRLSSQPCPGINMGFCRHNPAKSQATILTTPPHLLHPPSLNNPYPTRKHETTIARDKMGSMEDEPISDSGRVDAEIARFIRAEIKAAFKDHSQATLNAPGNEVDTEAQQPTKTSSEDKPPSPPTTWKDVVRAIAVLIPIIGTFGLVPVILNSGTDPHGFSTLAILLLIFLFLYFGAILMTVCGSVLYFKSPSSLDYGNMKWG